LEGNKRGLLKKSMVHEMGQQFQGNKKDTKSGSPSRVIVAVGKVGSSILWFKPNMGRVLKRCGRLQRKVGDK